MDTKDTARKLEDKYKALCMRVAETEVNALAVLEEIAENDSVRAQIRVNAANHILKHGVECREYINNMQLQSKLEMAREIRENLVDLLNDGN